MLMPQGLDATHSSKLFPVNESRRTLTLLGLIFSASDKVWMRCASPQFCQPGFSQFEKNPGGEDRGIEILGFTCEPGADQDVPT